jgi:hypothetical protein
MDNHHTSVDQRIGSSSPNSAPRRRRRAPRTDAEAQAWEEEKKAAHRNRQQVYYNQKKAKAHELGEEVQELKKEVLRLMDEKDDLEVDLDISLQENRSLKKENESLQMEVQRLREQMSRARVSAQGHPPQETNNSSFADWSFGGAGHSNDRTGSIQSNGMTGNENKGPVAATFNHYFDYGSLSNVPFPARSFGAPVLLPAQDPNTEFGQYSMSGYSGDGGSSFPSH